MTFVRHHPPSALMSQHSGYRQGINHVHVCCLSRNRMKGMAAGA